MKKIILLVSICFSISILSYSQKAEFLYFKADLACCKAKSCNTLEGEIKAMIEKNYPKGNVVFKTVKISDEANKDLVAKYSAKSQTCILVVKKKKTEVFYDMSELVKNYLVAQPDAKELVGQEFILGLQKNLKKK